MKPACDRPVRARNAPFVNLATSSMFASEKEIMDLWDSGLCARAIAERLGKKEDFVLRTIRLYHVACKNTDDLKTQRSGEALLAALHKFHPETRGGIHP